MRPPRHLGPYPDRGLDCEEAIEDSVIALVDQAEAAGWLRTEALTAITKLGHYLSLADQATEADQEWLDAIKRSKPHKQ